MHDFNPLPATSALLFSGDSRQRRHRNTEKSEEQKISHSEIYIRDATSWATMGVLGKSCTKLLYPGFISAFLLLPFFNKSFV